MINNVQDNKKVSFFVFSLSYNGSSSGLVSIAWNNNNKSTSNQIKTSHNEARFSKIYTVYHRVVQGT